MSDEVLITVVTETLTSVENGTELLAEVVIEQATLETAAAQGPPGASGAPGAPTMYSSRHDYVSASSVDYIGLAVYGSADTAAVWTIRKITVAADGSTTTKKATSVAWTNRLTAAYA